MKQTAIAAATLSASSLNTFAFGQRSLERRCPAKKVIIIGAGLVGLSATYELTQAGHDVTVLEVRIRPEARVHTLRDPFAEGLYAEAGAIRKNSPHYATLTQPQPLKLVLGLKLHLLSGHGQTLVSDVECPERSKRTAKSFDLNHRQFSTSVSDH